jgi:hypothetical protein
VRRLSRLSDDERKLKKLRDQSQGGPRTNTTTDVMLGNLEDHEEAMRTLRLAQQLVLSLLQHTMIAGSEKSVLEILSAMESIAMVQMWLFGDALSRRSAA